MLRRHQFPDLLSNHLMCHIAPRNFQNFLPCRPNTQHVIAKVCFTAVVQCWGISMQSWVEEEVVHYKPREEAVISLSWKLRICQGAKFSPILAPSSPNFSFVPVSCLRPDGLEILNGNQAVCQFTPGSPWRRRSSQWKFAPKISYKTIACGTWYVKGMEISRKNSRNFLQTNWLLGRCSAVKCGQHSVNWAEEGNCLFIDRHWSAFLAFLAASLLGKARAKTRTKPARVKNMSGVMFSRLNAKI